MNLSTNADAARRHGPAPRPRPLDDLLSEADRVMASASSTPITAITSDSNEVVPGSLFVAIRGTHVDGHAFVADAVAKGAAAVVVETGFADDLAVPVVEVEDTRRTLAELAAAWYGNPAQRLALVGITGTAGKTSVLTMLEAILVEAGRSPGVVGSLGLRLDGHLLEETGYTSPGPLLLQRSLARIADGGGEVAAMEVTSHALVQERVTGLVFGLGIFTNLVPLEHSDYHGSFRNYVKAKARFFTHLRKGCPLVYNSDDRGVERLVGDADIRPVGCGRSSSADVRVEEMEMSTEGTSLELNVRRALPRVGGGEVAPLRLPLQLRLLGRSNVSNATLAAAAALCLGVDPESVRSAICHFPPPPRRMEVLHRGRFTVVDDTVGHPDSLSALFEVAAAFAPRRIHIAFAVRGQRGPEINGHLAETLAVWAERLPLGTLVVTRSKEAIDEINRVEDEELTAFCEPLRRRAIPYLERDALHDAVRDALSAAAEGDLVLLLGAQGMDDGHETAREWLATHVEA